MKKIVAAALLFVLALCAPAFAQFAGQQNNAGTGAGSINAQTFTLSGLINYNQILNTQIIYTPNASGGTANTGATSITVTGDSGALASVPVRKLNNYGGGLLALTGGELQNGQSVTLMYDGTFFQIISGQYGQATAGSMTTSATPSVTGVVNLALTQSVASDLLTVNLLANDTQAAPTANHPVLITFNDTSTQGAAITATITASISMAAATTSSLGCANNATCRVWVTAICQTVVGTACTSVLLGLSVQSSLVSGNFSCFPLLDDNAVTTGTGTGGGTSLGTIYTSVSALSGKMIRVLGYVEATWVSGTGWTGFGPRPGRLFGPSVPRPCMPTGNVQFFKNGSKQTVSGTTVTITSLGQSITPTSSLNYIHAVSFGQMTLSGGGLTGAAQMARSNAGTNPSNLFGTLFAANYQFSAGGGGSGDASTSVPLDGYDQPGVTTSTPYTVYVWNPSASSTMTWLDNPNATQNIGTIRLEEIMGSLEPANDNAPLSMVG